MLNLNEVLEFIKNSDSQEFNQIRNAVAVRKSELTYDAKISFRVGDTVGINHRKVDSNQIFRIIKINSKNIKVQASNVDKGRVGGMFTVSPSLLIKK